MIPVTVISLERSKGRRLLVRQQLDGLHIPFRFFDAIDGSNFSRSALMKVAPKGGSNYSGLLTAREIGCALSHLSIIKQIAEGENVYAAVIEDDIVVLPEAVKILSEQYLKAIPEFDILQLDGGGSRKRRLTLHLYQAFGRQFCALPRCNISIGAVIYSRKGARKILGSIKSITSPIDNMIFFDQCAFALRIIETRPSVVSRNTGLLSDIGFRPRPQRLLTKSGRELRRFRNWGRRWCGFVRAWGLSCILRLRLA